MSEALKKSRGHLLTNRRIACESEGQFIPPSEWIDGIDAEQTTAEGLGGREEMVSSDQTLAPACAKSAGSSATTNHGISSSHLKRRRAESFAEAAGRSGLLLITNCSNGSSDLTPLDSDQLNTTTMPVRAKMRFQR